MDGKAGGHLKHISLLVICLVLFAPLPSFGSSPQELLREGSGALKDGFYQVAEAQFREFLQTFPHHSQFPNVMYLLGKALYKQQKFAESKETFITLLFSQTGFQTSDAAFFWLGRSYEKLGDLLNAQNNYLTIVTKYPHSLWYHPSLFLLGRLSLHEGRYKRSEMYLRKVLKDRTIDPSLSCSTKFWLGIALYEQGRYETTEDLLQDVVDCKLHEGLLEEALYWLGETHIKLKKYKKGAVVFRSLLDHFPRSSFAAHALYGESLCLYMSDKKEKTLQRLLTLQKDFFHTSLLPSVLYFMGKVYIDLDRYQEATEIFKEFLSRFPQDPLTPQIMVNLGWCYLKRGDLAQVKEITYNIVKLSPYEHEREKALAQYILAELNTYEGNCQEAMPYWFNLLNTSYRQEALFKIAGCSFQENKFKEGLVNIDLLHLEYQNFYNMDQALWMQGESYRELGNVSEASKAYQRIIREHKKSSWYPWSLYRMITFLLEEEDMRGAERYFNVLYRKFPHHDLSYEAALAVGIRKAERGNYESSLDYLTIAARSAGSEVAKHALCWQGEIHFNLGEFKKAWDAYQKLIEGYTSSYDMLAAMAYLEMGNIQHLLKDPKKARVAYKKAIELSQDEMFKENIKVLLKELKEVKRENS